jgi:hypothetical protein
MKAEVSLRENIAWNAKRSVGQSFSRSLKRIQLVDRHDQELSL